MQSLALVSLDDLKIILSEKAIKNEVWGSQKAAEYLEVSVTTLHKEATKGVVPGVRIGKDWKFSSIALFELVKNGGLKGARDAED